MMKKITLIISAFFIATFYMQSYNDKIISIWVDFAYKKIKKLIKLPRNFDNAFKFMMLMTKEQIETVGY